MGKHSKGLASQKVGGKERGENMVVGAEAISKRVDSWMSKQRRVKTENMEGAEAC